MEKKCNCGEKCIVTKENLKEKIANLSECSNCEDIAIKKFSPLKDVIDFNSLDKNYKRCSCGKRPLDIVMSHILKIMINEKIVPENASLRKNSPIPLPTIFYSTNNPQFIGKESLILIHLDFTKEVAQKILKEVSEVKGVIKGNPQETIGILEKGKTPNVYELLGGCDLRCDILRTLIKDNGSLKKIIINKEQSKNHIEVAPTSEDKLLKLYNYLENNEKYKNNKEEFTVLDAMCGSGSIGIFLLFYGFKEVIFNDIWKEAINTSLLNLEVNGFKYELVNNSEEIAIGKNFKVYNKAIENLEIKADLCIIDCYPQTDCKKIEEVAKKIATDVLII